MPQGRQPHEQRFERIPRPSAELLAKLLADAQLADDIQVLLRIHLAKIIQQSTATANHSEQTTAAAVIFRMRPHVLGQRIDPSGQYGDLNLGRTAIVVPSPVLADDFLFPFFGDRHVKLRLLRCGSFSRKRLDTSKLLAPAWAETNPDSILKRQL